MFVINAVRDKIQFFRFQITEKYLTELDNEETTQTATVCATKPFSLGKESDRRHILRNLMTILAVDVARRPM